MVKYRKARIRAILVQDDMYNGINIKVLKFVEVSDMDDIKKERSNIKDDDDEKGKPILAEASKTLKLIIILH